MSFIEQLNTTLEHRLRELEGEIVSLHAAREALVGARGRSAALGAGATATGRRPAARGRAPGATGRARAVRGRAEPAGADRRPTTDAQVIRRLARATTPPPGPSAPAANAPGPQPAQAGGEAKAAPSSPASRAPRRPRISDADLQATLEELLHQAPEGLSAVTLSKRAGAPYSRVGEILKRMASEGRAQSTGSRRTSLWRLVSEEQLIAERAAELERLAARSA